MATRMLLALAILGGAASGQEAKPAPAPGVDQKSIDEAIRKGVAYLKSQESVFNTDPHGTHASELVLWTYVHAGLREGDASFDALLRAMLAEPHKSTCRVSLQAMILEEIHRVRHQKQLIAIDENVHLYRPPAGT